MKHRERPISAIGPPLDTSQVPGREVTRVQVSVESRRFDQHWRYLDAAERLRAGRFRYDADRLRFVIARGSLRQLLGSRLGVAPGDIVFAANEFGKPSLQGAPIALHFNTSHSGDWVLHATDTVAPIGVDVEAVRPDLAHIEQFERVLSTEERALLNTVPPQHRARAFATVWVRKEAYVKALGEGMSRPLHDICISLDASGQPRLRYDRNAAGSLPRWWFEDIDIDAGHVGCLVYQGDG